MNFDDRFKPAAKEITLRGNGGIPQTLRGGLMPGGAQATPISMMPSGGRVSGNATSNFMPAGNQSQVALAGRRSPLEGPAPAPAPQAPAQAPAQAPVPQPVIPNPAGARFQPVPGSQPQQLAGGPYLQQRGTDPSKTVFRVTLSAQLPNGQIYDGPWDVEFPAGAQLMGAPTVELKRG